MYSQLQNMDPGRSQSQEVEAEQCWEEFYKLILQISYNIYRLQNIRRVPRNRKRITKLYKQSYLILNKIIQGDYYFKLKLDAIKTKFRGGSTTIKLAKILAKLKYNQVTSLIKYAIKGSQMATYIIQILLVTSKRYRKLMLSCNDN